jgi:hypothetical protein
VFTSIRALPENLEVVQAGAIPPRLLGVPFKKMTVKIWVMLEPFAQAPADFSQMTQARAGTVGKPGEAPVPAELETSERYLAPARRWFAEG